jgi:RIP homotypic interaction motif
MEPITLILGALAAGALAGVKDDASNAVKDAYAGLRRLVAARFAGKPAAQLALAEHEVDPDTWQAPLRKALTDTRTDADPAVIAAARQLAELLDQAGAAAGKYTVNLQGAQGVQVGDHNRQDNVYNSPPQVP